MREAPTVGELTPPDRTLMGPGPSDVHPRVLRAMSTPLVGHLDPSFVEIMDEVQELLRYTFRTDNKWTIPVSGTGSAAMETAISNLVEPGDGVLLRTSAYWGDRMANMARRSGGRVIDLDVSPFAPIDPEDVKAAFEEHDIDVFGFCHADTTTGIRQTNVSTLADIARENDAYTIMDCVTSLGGVEVQVDEWGVDVAYSANQKCLSSPPGSSPFTANDRAMEKICNRDEDPKTWYLDLSLLNEYWGDDRSYHHTAPITNVYALREALRLVAEEGIEERWERHKRIAGTLKEGVRDLGLEMNAEDEYWLPSLNAVRVPDGVDDKAVINYLLEEYNLEIASGLGELDGDIWRIGCMGHSARRKNVEYVLEALEDALETQGFQVATTQTPSP